MNKNYTISRLSTVLILILTFSGLAFQTANAQTGLFINEIMASNSTVITDPDYKEYADWIEIYNSGTSEVNLLNYFITDDLSKPRQHRITTDLIIPAGGYKLIWADGMNTGIHTSFKLSADGETIALFNPAGTLVDSLTFGPQTTDVSYGRYPDGSGQWLKLKPSTPGSTNSAGMAYSKVAVPELSAAGGFYNSPVTLTITCPDSGASIYYTLNGEEPTRQSFLYTAPFSIDTTIALTVKAFKEGSLPSDKVISTYFINFQSVLPVFSLVTDPDNFFSDTSGIYVEGTNGILANCSKVPANWNQDWERPVNLEFYEKDKSLAFSLGVGVKIFGGCTRLYPMKSLAFYFRKIYGPGKLHYRLFDDMNVNEFNGFTLRSSGQDWWRTMFRDGMVQTLIEQGMDVDYQNYRPSVLFINGRYWGIHNIRENISETYLASHHGVNPDSLDMIDIKGLTADAGDKVAFDAMMKFITDRNLANSSNYNYMKSIVDIDEYIDYQVAEIYSANGDWPGGNMKLWRERSPKGKWRWIAFDLDFTFGGNARGLYSTNTLSDATSPTPTAYHNPEWSTRMLRKLIENSEFKNEFIQRFAVHMNTTFRTAHVLHVIDSMKAAIAPEIPRHKARWDKSISFAKTWDELVELMREFAVKRPAAMRSHIYSKFNVEGAYSLVLGRNNPSWGKIFAHGYEIKYNDSLNLFFKNIPLKLKAVPLPGYRFVKWQGATSSEKPEIELLLSANSTLKALFEPDDSSGSRIVINEINYKSSSMFDTDDWVELYNSSSSPVDIAGWKLYDGDETTAFVFPDSTTIDPHGYLVVSRDTLKMKSLHLNKMKLLGNMDFGLDSKGDLVKLIDSLGNTIDSVLYKSSGDWPSSPAGMGPALALVDPKSDNSLPRSWSASVLHGTPGRINDVYLGTGNELTANPAEFRLFGNYPNPFNNSTVISYSIAERSRVRLNVYDILGREVARLVDEDKESGYYDVSFSTNLGSGVYIYVLQSGKNIKSGKMVMIK